MMGRRAGVNEEKMRDESKIDENLKAQKVCRICHFGLSSAKHAVPSILCEICGKIVKNITSNLEDTSIFMMEWNEMRLAATTLDTSQESSHRCKKSLSNFLMACLVLAFVLPWFFRVDIL
ncbi:RING-CH-type domain-containing protein [Abeliophyllum distichum]|uniref:RING-CH-type domain-containing protein n=1 Tax=Abeliophyllum distichum TaxID=126358 RepID=A0ABD1THS8_9LAMI